MRVIGILGKGKIMLEELEDNINFGYDTILQTVNGIVTLIENDTTNSKFHFNKLLDKIDDAIVYIHKDYRLSVEDKEYLTSVINRMIEYAIKTKTLTDDEGNKVEFLKFKHWNITIWRLNNIVNNTVKAKYLNLSDQNLKDISKFVDEYLEILDIDSYNFDIDEDYLDILREYILDNYDLEISDFFSMITLTGVDEDFDSNIYDLLISIFIENNNSYDEDDSDNNEECVTNNSEYVDHDSDNISDLSETSQPNRNVSAQAQPMEPDLLPVHQEHTSSQVLRGFSRKMKENKRKLTEKEVKKVKYYAKVLSKKLIIYRSVNSRRHLSTIIAKFIIHLHFSRGISTNENNQWIPISYKWLRINKLRKLTEFRIISPNSGGVLASSVKVLEYLDFLTVKEGNRFTNTSNEYKISLLSKAIVSLYSLVKRIHFKSLDFGNRSSLNNINIPLIFNNYGFIPNVDLINKVFEKLNDDKRKFNYAQYFEDRKKICKLLSYEKNDYKKTVLDNYFNLGLDKFKAELELLSKLTID